MVFWVAALYSSATHELEGSAVGRVSRPVQILPSLNPNLTLNPNRFPPIDYDYD